MKAIKCESPKLDLVMPGLLRSGARQRLRPDIRARSTVRLLQDPHLILKAFINQTLKFDSLAHRRVEATGTRHLHSVDLGAPLPDKLSGHVPSCEELRADRYPKLSRVSGAICRAKVKARALHPSDTLR
jgi:hypothetical protein